MNKSAKFILFASAGFVIIYFVFSGFTNLSPTENQEAIAIDTIPKPEDYISHTSREYSFKYPKTWNVKDMPPDKRSFELTTIRNYNDAFYNSASNTPAISKLSKITIAKVPKDINQSFQSWLDDYVARGASDWGTKVLRKENALVDSNEAIFHIEQLGRLPSPVMYINKNTHVYIIIGGAFNPLLDDVFHRLVKDFEFN